MYGYFKMYKFISKVCPVRLVNHRSYKVWRVRLSQTLDKHIHDLSSSDKNSLAVSQLADVFKTQVINLWYLFVLHERPWVRTKPGRGTSNTKYFPLVSQSVNLAIVGGYACPEFSD
jgi:hypothetical protein